MSYQETLDYLFTSMPVYQRIGSDAYKADLENAYVLDDYFNYPHKSFKTIHIAGTNGKGSVSHMIASVLKEAGYKTGLYTSPHLLDFRERIKIDGEVITEQFVIDFTEKHRAIFDKIKPSFFEMTVFMAFDYFRENKVEIAVIEVGLGGRLDTTNIIIPEISVITNISKDHTQILGNTIEKIAYEKAGIIKENIPVIIGRTQKETKPVFESIAEEKNSQIFFAEDLFIPDYQMQNLNGNINYYFSRVFYWKFENIEADLKGIYQKENISTVLTTLAILDQNRISIKSDNIQKGIGNVIKNTTLMGRWMEISFNPRVVCDNAHNEDGIAVVIKQISQTPYEKLHMVLGFVSDKDLSSILPILPENAQYYLCEPDIPRARNVIELQTEFDKCKLKNFVFKKVEDAFNEAKNAAGKNDFIFIGGSSFVVADFLKWKNYNSKY
jgi:dihydrofolate synthase / folylpolyglutamate synthase